MNVIKIDFKKKKQVSKKTKKTKNQFEEAAERNERNEERLKKERAKANKKVLRTYQIKK